MKLPLKFSTAHVPLEKQGKDVVQTSGLGLDPIPTRPRT